MKIRSVLLSCLLAAPLLQAVDSAMLDLVPARTSFVIGVRVRNVVDSPLAKSMAGEMRKVSTEMNQLMSLAGFDPFQDVDEVLVAAMGEGKNAPGLMIVRGRFGAARKKATGTPYKNVPISGTMKSTTAFLDDSLLIAGDRPVVRAAIDARGKGGEFPMRDKISELAGRYDIYGFGKVPEGAVPDGAAGSAAKGIDRFQFGVNVGRGIDFAAEMHARTDADAKSLNQTVQLLAAMAAQQQGGGDIAKNLSVKMDGRTLRFALSVPEDELMKAVQARMAAPKGGLPAIAAAGEAPAAPVRRATPQRDTRYSQDTVLVVTGSESDGGTIVFTDPHKKN
jgi:hypothetical protein